MKQKLLLGSCVVLVILASCRKDFTCICTEDGYTQEYEYISIKKEDAKSECEDQQEKFNANGQNVKCNLD